jgi:hypothetical protein
MAYVDNLSGPSDIELAIRRGASRLFGGPGGGGHIPELNKPPETFGMRPPPGYSKTPPPPAPSSPPLGYRLRQAGNTLSNAAGRAYDATVDFTSRNIVEPVAGALGGARLPALGGAAATGAAASGMGRETQPATAPQTTPQRPRAGGVPALAGRTASGDIGGGSFSVESGNQAGIGRVREGMASGRIAEGVPTYDSQTYNDTASRERAHAAGMAAARAGGSYDEAFNRVMGAGQGAPAQIPMLGGAGQAPSNPIQDMLDLVSRPTYNAYDINRQKAARRYLGKSLPQLASAQMQQQGQQAARAGQTGLELLQMALNEQRNAPKTALESSRAGLYQRALAGDQEAIRLYQQLEGRQRATPQLKTVKQYDDMGQVTGETLVAFDPSTGQASPVQVGGSAQQAQSAPAGMRQVGTKGGKPVYEDANGNRFIDE